MVNFIDVILQGGLTLIPAVVLYLNFKDRSDRLEKRLTGLEKDIEFSKEFKREVLKRLNSHDEQNKAILVLAEQVRSLTNDVKEIRDFIFNKGA
jgi:hypothetical protein